MSESDKKGSKAVAKKTKKRQPSSKKTKVTKTKKVAPQAPSKAKPKEKQATKVKPAPPKKAEKVKPAPKAVAVKTEKVVAHLGAPPSAMVETRHSDLPYERVARGFSSGELGSAGITIEFGRSQGVSVDIRRRSVLDRNVVALKQWFKSSSPKSEETVSAAAEGKKN